MSKSEIKGPPDEGVTFITVSKPETENKLTKILPILESLSFPWEWIIRYDGPLPVAPVSGENVKVVANGRVLGKSVTRNLALLDASYDLIFPLEDTDLPIASGLSSMFYACVNRVNTFVYSAARSIDCFPDGEEMQRFVVPNHPLTLVIGHFSGMFLGDGSICLNPLAFMARKDALLSIGGWPAVEHGADLDIFLTLSNSYAGTFVNEDALKHYLSLEEMGDILETSSSDQEWCAQRQSAISKIRGGSIYEFEFPRSEEGLSLRDDFIEKVKGFCQA